MSEAQTKALLLKLRALFDTIAKEAATNPAFARQVEASLHSIIDRAAAEANAETIARRFAPSRRASPPPPPPWASPAPSYPPASPPRAVPAPSAWNPPPSLARGTPDSPSMLDGVTFDPLECHIEAAVMGGREQEARAFLGRLDRSQLEEVVKAQRLPGQRSLTQAIRDAEQTSAVNAIVDSAAERVKRRFSATG
ncbi:hypothetical protein Rvan_0058 [Rhodomicrobium vannielii ATCC 17100]|uniref:Uncharacterized protein n=1 Tax=Rhodomicrobium vannielii (strain ATCC 17100 / DSM 162 / LMG 4299 / NCIMB 10020 / ATH 3.1.1) TaxID=648757 RepID=E3I4Z4_RHOVT|nr:hypothetical protein [Rhodomicrobium vannielii]ADP69348.1 hypothetical protein Rvan_0058 [Rhodomicrobium vannielii ATCC 17100]